MTNLVRTVLLVVLFLVASTVFFYPTSRPGSVLSVEPKMWEIEKTDIIELSPIFDVGGRNSYSFLLSPDLDTYKNNYPEVKRFVLGGSDVIFTQHGSFESPGMRFSFNYWILICVLPSVLTGVGIAAILHKVKLI